VTYQAFLLYYAKCKVLTKGFTDLSPMHMLAEGAIARSTGIFKQM
jgi:hypothetical protein